jgi:DNA-binding SARP family transcriptional activator
LGEPVEAAAGAATGPTHPAGALAAILDEALVALGSECRPLLAQIARLPLVDAGLVGAVSGEPGLFERAFSAGIPFTPARAQWWDLPGPVREHLALLAPANPDAMRRAAHEFTRRDELGPALELLLATGDPEGAAALLAATPPSAEDALDTLELRALFDQLPREAVDAQPGVLVVVARRFGHAGRYSLCCELLEQARDVARRSGDPLLERAAAAELIKVELLAELSYEEAESAAREILRAAGPGEKLTRARASEFLGYALCRQVDAIGRRPEAALVEAEDCFARASRLYLELGMRSAAAFIAVDWSSLIEFPLGHAVAAMERIEEALLLVANLPRAWAFVMLWRAAFAAELGQDEVCGRSVDEVFLVAEQKKSSFLVAQAHWRLAVLASYRGEGEATLEHVRQVELHGKLWWGLGSGEFLAEAADLVDRVGHRALALEYLARGKADPKDAGHLVALADAVLEARHGDPVTAEQRLLGLARERVDPCELWRVTLLRAYAGFRRGEDGVAATLAAQAFEEAARLGQPELPLIRERTITEQLLGLALGTGHPAAVALRASALPRSLAVLGRFAMTVAGRPVPLGSGQEVRLLKFVTVSGGHVHAEQAIETMWPGVGVSSGRHRLRTVLNRLRAAAGDVLLRDGDALALDQAVHVDVQEFLAEAQSALVLAAKDPAMAAAVARGAMARYRGELLPDDRYEDWAESPRRRAQSVMLDLLDLCAAEEARRGDLDALRRTVERTIEFAPYDDVRCLRAASALYEQGRRGEALAIVHRARSAFSQIGLDPPDALLELERTLVA